MAGRPRAALQYPRAYRKGETDRIVGEAIVWWCGLEGAEQVGEVAINVGELHLVENYELGVYRLSRRRMARSSVISRVVSGMERSNFSACPITGA